MNDIDFSQNSNRWSHFATDSQMNRNTNLTIFTSDNSSNRNFDFKRNDNNLLTETYPTKIQDNKNNNDIYSLKYYENNGNTSNSNFNARNLNPSKNYQSKNAPYEIFNRNFDNKYGALN